MILQRPGVGLNGAMWIGMPAKMVEVPAIGRLRRVRHELADLLGIEHLGAKALMLPVLERAPVELELPLIECDADTVRLKLRRVAQQRIELRPESLLLEKQWAVVMRAAAAIAAGGAPTDDPRLENQHIDTLAREPPSGAETGHPAADHDHCRARVCTLPHSLATGSFELRAAAVYSPAARQKGTHCDAIPNQLSQCSAIAGTSGRPAS